MKTSFDCARTCRRWQECRFTPILLRAGVTTYVHSHTVKTEIEFRDKDALREVVERMGGRIIGEGSHRLYERPATGYGFTLPNWSYPLVAQDGELAYDDYGGKWGNVADIATLKAGYAIAASRNAAEHEGWMHQEQSDGSLMIYHPDGGTLTVRPDGSVDAAGFLGSGCAEAGAVIERAIGRTVETAHKAEYYAESATVSQSEE